jgi:hypothetical protein
MTHVAVSQICRLALEPATARVVGSSGQKEAEKTLPCTCAGEMEKVRIPDGV